MNNVKSMKCKIIITASFIICQSKVEDVWVDPRYVLFNLSIYIVFKLNLYIMSLQVNKPSIQVAYCCLIWHLHILILYYLCKTLQNTFECLVPRIMWYHITLFSQQPLSSMSETSCLYLSTLRSWVASTFSIAMILYIRNKLPVSVHDHGWH